MSYTTGRGTPPRPFPPPPDPEPTVTTLAFLLAALLTLAFAGGLALACVRHPFVALCCGLWDVLAKAAGLSTLLAVGAELATSDEDRLIRAIRDGSQDTINQAGQQIIQRQLQVAPTLTIRPGFPVRMIVTRDLVLEPYRG